MTVRLHGIPNCDTVRRARAWFEQRGVPAAFHDFRKDGVPDDERFGRWLAAVGRERLLNRRGTAWRQLDAQTQAGVVDDASAMAVMRAHPSTIKRPVVEWPDGAITVGFDEADWAARV